MAFSHTATGINSTLNSSSVTSDAINTTGATLLVAIQAIVSNGTDASLTLSDSKSNTWTHLAFQDIGASNGQPRIRISYCLSPTVGSGHTATFASSNFSYPMVALMAFGGGTAAFDVVNGSRDAIGASTLQTGSVSPANDNSVLVTGACPESLFTYTTPTINSSFTVSASQSALANQTESLAVGYKIQTTKGAENPTWTVDSGTSADAAVIAVFKPVTAAPAGLFALMQRGR